MQPISDRFGSRCPSARRPEFLAQLDKAKKEFIRLNKEGKVAKGRKLASPTTTD